ncbi:uncharacterized protein METZ01_LOCUS385138, partial [marine metagenome]
MDARHPTPLGTFHASPLGPKSKIQLISYSSMRRK